jgi:hypothetical protein
MGFHNFNSSISSATVVKVVPKGVSRETDVGQAMLTLMLPGKHSEETTSARETQTEKKSTVDDMVTGLYWLKKESGDVES